MRVTLFFGGEKRNAIVTVLGKIMHKLSVRYLLIDKK